MFDINSVAIRVVGRSPSYMSPKNRNNWLKPNKIISKMQNIISESGYVALGISYVMSLDIYDPIRDVLLFANSMGDSFIYKADVVGIRNNYSLKLEVPEVWKRYEMPYWVCEKCNVWFLLKGLVQLNPNDVCKYITSDGKEFSEVWKTPRYRMMYLKKV